jgi:hypothetical protein
MTELEHKAMKIWMDKLHHVYGTMNFGWVIGICRLAAWWTGSQFEANGRPYRIKEEEWMELILGKE